MSVTLRILLIVVSLITAFWILRKIRKNKVKQEDATYWICFAFILMIMGIFPQISFKLAELLGIQSPANFIFLLVIFMLVEKILTLSIQVSTLQNKLEILTAEVALRTKGNEEKKEEEK